MYPWIIIIFSWFATILSKNLLFNNYCNHTENCDILILVTHCVAQRIRLMEKKHSGSASLVAYYVTNEIWGTLFRHPTLWDHGTQRIIMFTLLKDNIKLKFKPVNQELYLDYYLLFIIFYSPTQISICNDML